MNTIVSQAPPVPGSAPGNAGVWYYQDLLIDPARQVISRRGEEIPLTPLEYALFEALLRRLGEVCTRNELLASVWGITAPVQTRTVDVFISKLRSKLCLKQELHSVLRQGYLLERPASEPDGPGQAYASSEGP